MNREDAFERLREARAFAEQIAIDPYGDGAALAGKVAEAVAVAVEAVGALLQPDFPLPLRIKRIGSHSLPLPSYAHEGDAGMDLRLAFDPPKIDWLQPGLGASIEKDIKRVGFYSGFIKVPSGFAVGIPRGYEGCVRPRSGLTAKGIVAHVGTIDSGYTGEIFVVLENRSGSWFTINHGDRIAQLVVSPVARCEIREVEELGASERGSAGFGSTGV